MVNTLLLFYDLLFNNFVLAIAVLTILIRLLTLPLNLRQQKTSLKMQSMQPQIQAIQKKYKENPSKMQEEFKKIGYNPTESLTGCLPLLIQFPILIGLYRAIITILGSTPLALFELTDRVYDWVDGLTDVATLLPVANKFLWLNLAQPDPYYILPVLVFATMFIQQRLMSPAKKKNEDKKGKSESPMAGMTQSMQYTMPLMFGFFSLSFPSGLSIYFILSNLIGIGQGYLTRANMAKEEALANKAGGDIGKTTGIPEPESASKKVTSGSPGSSSYRSTKQSKRKKRSAKR
ncbi:MAG: YidC/Oxa1 family membrane protein insertase [Candidatus Promineifilaceae bacterium]